MYGFPIGVMLDSFRLPLREALAKASECGAAGIQMYATRGAVSPDALTPSGRRELLDMIRSHGLRVSALCGDFGLGFGNREKNGELVEKSKRVLELAKELETDVVTTHIGVVPDDVSHPRYGVMQEACYELAAFADSLDAHFAIETGPEPAETLKNFLDSLGSTGVAVNLDPANLVMVTGDDPVKAVHTLGRYIVHTHAKDGRMLYRADPEVIYGIRGGSEARAFEELPLGEGNVDFPKWMCALEEEGYRGFLTVEREVGSDPAGDIRKAVAFLEDIVRM